MRAVEDEDLSELVDLIEHEPERGGLLGVSEDEHARYLERIREMIARLRLRAGDQCSIT